MSFCVSRIGTSWVQPASQVKSWAEEMIDQLIPDGVAEEVGSVLSASPAAGCDCHGIILEGDARTVCDNAPDEFNLVYPENGRTGVPYGLNAPITFAWEGSPDADRPIGDIVTYTFGLYDSRDSETPLVSGEVDGNEFTFTPLVSNYLTCAKRYYWKVWATDSCGNVTESREMFSFTTIEPTAVWTQTYTGRSNEGLGGNGIALDGSGNVYVAGWESRMYDEITHEFINEGTNIWVQQYDGSGVPGWTQWINGVRGSGDAGNDLVLFGDSVYVAGRETLVLDQDTDIWLGKFRTDGSPIWSRTYNGIGNEEDEGLGVAVDNLGNIYMTGYEALVDGEDWRVWVRKYDADGAVVWTDTFNGPVPPSGFASSFDSGTAIAVDGEGNAYVTGYVEEAGEEANIWIRRYDPAGSPVWTRTYNGPASGNDAGHGIVVDNLGNLYVVGDMAVSADGLKNKWISKFDIAGNLLWSRTNEAGVDLALPFVNPAGITFDNASDNIYVIGTNFSGTNDDIWIGKYDADGNPLCMQVYNGTADGNDQGHDIAVDGSGGVYVTGESFLTEGVWGSWVRKYTNF